MAGGKQDGSWCSWLQDLGHITRGSCALCRGWWSLGFFEEMHLPARGGDGVWVLIEESCCSRSVAVQLRGSAGAGALLPLLPRWEKPGWDLGALQHPRQRIAAAWVGPQAVQK